MTTTVMEDMALKMYSEITLTVGLNLLNHLIDYIKQRGGKLHLYFFVLINVLLIITIMLIAFYW